MQLQPQPENIPTLESTTDMLKLIKRSTERSFYDGDPKRNSYIKWQTSDEAYITSLFK